MARNKNGSERIHPSGLLAISTYFLIAAITNFIDKNNITAVAFLVIGIIFVLLTICSFKKNKHK